MTSKTQLRVLALVVFILIAWVNAKEKEKPSDAVKFYVRPGENNKGRPDIIYPRAAYIDKNGTYMQVTDNADKSMMPKPGETCNFMHTLIILKEENKSVSDIMYDSNTTMSKYLAQEGIFDNFPFSLFERGCDDTGLTGEIKCDFVFDKEGYPIVLHKQEFTVKDYANILENSTGTFKYKENAFPTLKTKLYYKKCYCPYQTMAGERLYFSEFDDSNKYNPTCTTVPPSIPGLDDALAGKPVKADACHK